MKKHSLLAIEDEVTTQVLLQRSLAAKYDLQVVATIERAKESLTFFRPDLILLDLYLPDGNGFDFFNQLKENYQTSRIPVIFLTLEADINVKVKSFTAGAYDYITKPFDQLELIARVDAHCTRSIETLAAQYNPEIFDDLVFNKEAKQVYRKNPQGEKNILSLTPMEYRLLECFLNHVGKTLSREQIAKEVWNKLHFQSRTIDRHVSSLRKKLGSTGTYLKTISHGGYLLSLNNEV